MEVTAIQLKKQNDDMNEEVGLLGRRLEGARAEKAFLMAKI